MTAAHPAGVAALEAAYRHRDVSVAEVVARVTERLESQPTGPVWISLVEASDLFTRARDLDAVAPAQRGKLHGVPFAVKDNIDVAGLPTTAGCPDFSYLPVRTATSVQRLLDEGAILVGKTNLDQFATGLTGVRSPYGACDSVFGGGLVSGGSSSGSAVAVAAGLVAFSLGTDTAGSGRVPAALNGIVGIKPSRGLVSTSGVVAACRSLDCVSVFAHDVVDGWSALRMLAAHDLLDPWSRRAPRLAALSTSKTLLRVGVPTLSTDDFFGDAAMRDSFDTGVSIVTGLATDTQLVDLDPFLDAGDLLYGGPWIAERLSGLAGFLDTHPDSVLPVTRAILERGREFDGVATFAGLHRLQHLKSIVDRVFESVDILVLPTVGTTTTHERVRAEPLLRNAELGRYTQFANLLDLAVVSVPNVLTRDGRPSSVSFLGPAGSDATLAALARSFELAAEPSPPSNERQTDGHTATSGAVVIDSPPAAGGEVLLAVVGHHLFGGARNHELVERRARLVEVTRTASSYRLYLVGGPELPSPGLVRCEPADVGGAAIEVELWAVPTSRLGDFLVGIPAPLGLGRVRLADGRDVVGFLCEAYVAATAVDITAFGGWRSYLAASAVPD